MKKSIETLFFAVLLSGIANAQLTVPEANFTPVLDGNNQEWPLENLIKEDKTGLSYFAVADDEFLYVLLVAAEMPFQQKIMRNGLELNFSSKTGKKKTSGKLLYPYNAEGESTMPQIRSEAGKRPDMEYMKELFLLRNKALLADGFVNKLKGGQTLDSSNGINLGINWNEAQHLVYEYKIPLNQLLADNGDPRDAANSIEMEVTVNGMEMSGAGMAGGAAMGAGGRGGAAGGGRGGAAGGGRGGAGGGRAGGGGQAGAAGGNAQAVDMMNKATFKTVLTFN